ncbi:MAG TPA: alpha/beta hydrolase [Nitriliruptoraceae bacterium]|nr:alpha/beta hydrolase [Nitriliruptoraceae bacterium]
MTDLAWEQHGSGESIVAVPAGIGSRRQYDAVVADLATDFHVVTMDPRGQGESPDPTQDYDDRQDVLDVMAAAGVSSAVLVGCSNGGRVVAEVAATRPDAVTGLVLLGPALPGVTWQDDPRALARLRACDIAIAEGEFDTAADTYAEFFFLGPDRTQGDLPDALRLRMRSLLMAAVAREQGAYDEGEPTSIDPPLKARLGDIEVDTLVAVGVHDHPSIKATARHYGEHLPNATVTSIVGVAHFPALEAPALTAELIRDHASLVSSLRSHRE